MKKMKDIFQSIDMTGSGYIFFSKQKSKSSSFSGGIFSIIMLFLIFYILISKFFDFFNLKIKNINALNFKTQSLRTMNNHKFFSNKNNMTFTFFNDEAIDNYRVIVSSINENNQNKIYILPQCQVENTSAISQCFDYSEFNQTQINSIKSFKLEDCDALKSKNYSILNPKELDNCNGDRKTFEEKFKNEELILSFSTNFYFFDLDINRINSHTSKKFINMSYNSSINYFANFEIIFVEFNRNDEIFNYKKYQTYINPIIERGGISVKEGFNFKFDFYDSFYNVSDYRINFYTSLDILSAVGGFIKIINLFISLFRGFFSQKFSMHEIFDDLICFSNDNTNISIGNTNKHINLSKLLEKEKEGNESINDIIGENPKKSNDNYEEKKKPKKNVLCYSPKKRNNFIKDIFSYENFIYKMKEISLLKYISLNQNYVEIMNMNDFGKKESFKIVETSLSESKFEEENFDGNLKEIEERYRIFKN